MWSSDSALTISENICSKLDSCKQFLWKHRGKIAVAAVVAVGATAYYNLSGQHQERGQDSDEEDEFDEEFDNVSSKNAIEPRTLLRLRKQYEKAAEQFLPTVKLRINEVVDISHVVKQIKEIRSSQHHQEDDADKEAQLWNEIKIASFTLLLVSTYMTCAVCVLLRVQLYALSRSIEGMTAVPGGLTGGGEENEYQIFRSLIEDTYKHMFGDGVVSLAAFVRQHVQEHLSDWSVNDKISVQYNELVSVIGRIRASIEADMGRLIRLIVIPTDDVATSVDEKVVQFVAQTFDLVESPMFSIAFTEAVEACFRHHKESIRRELFVRDGSIPVSGGGASGSVAITGGGAGAASTSTERLGYVSTPPLASILPQVKAIANRMLPPDSIGTEARTVMSGPALDTLCNSILRADLANLRLSASQERDRSASSANPVVTAVVKQESVV